jgi:hypothetical protein
VAYNDLKAQSTKEIERLKGLLEVEKKRRMNVQEDKLEKSTNLI